MRLARPFHRSCERVREQISVALDGELSQLERAHLHVHVARCAPCNAYAAEVGAIASLLRTAPLEVPALQIAFPRRSRFARRGFQVAAAAAVVLAAGMGSLDLASRATERAAAPALPSRAVPQVNDALEVDRSRLPGQRENGFRGRNAR